MKAMRLNILSLFALIAMAMSISSCGEDPIRGCMDEEAENFDALAVEDSGACVYPRDKFLGTYLGEINCQGDLSAVVTNPEFQIIISEGLDHVHQVSVLLTNLGLSIKGFATGNEIIINTMIPAFPFDANGDGTVDLPADLIITGGATLTDNNLDGELSIEAIASESQFPLTNDTCPLSGVKQ